MSLITGKCHENVVISQLIFALYLLFAPLNLELAILDLLLERGNHGEVVEGDVVVVVLDFVECLLVALLDVVDLVVLSLLHVAHLGPGLQCQVRPARESRDYT
jgi:hypothetical protein